VVGTGDIGTHVARLLAACGMRVTGVSRTGAPADAAFALVATVASLPDLVGEADVLVLTVPLTDATRHLVDRTLLARMRGAFLVNVGRGAVVDEAALPEALDAGRLRGAALDVFETEPLPPTSPLWADPRVMISPHVSGLTTVAGVVAGFGECLAAIRRGETPRWVVDRQRGY
jgi:phosphoglycerate dehydrogenase-like enzyme